MDIIVKPFNLNTLLTDLQLVFQLYLNKLDKQQVNIRLNAPADNIAVLTDKEQIFQILFYLMANAAKSISEGEISFGYKKVNNTGIEFFVSHKGKSLQVGTDKDNFNNFLRIGNNSQSAFRGLSFSELSIIKLLAEQIGSNISFDPEQGEVSTFRFDLAYVVIENSNSTVDSQPAINTFSSQNKVLIAEDDDNSMVLITHLFDKLQVPYLKATNGIEALKQIEENSDINLIIMDLSMPVMDGFDALLGIKIINSSIPVIALSAYSISDYRDKAMDAGFDDYLIKPVKKDLLIDCLRKHLILL